LESGMKMEKIGQTNPMKPRGDDENVVVLHVQ
jgi:hypothetical protein